MKKANFLPLIIGILIIGLFPISAYSLGESDIPGDTSSYIPDNWFGRIISKFNPSLFTVYGDTLKCSSTPTQIHQWKKTDIQRNIIITADPGENIFINWFRGSPSDGQYSAHLSDSRQFMDEIYLGYGGGSTVTLTCDASAYWNYDCYFEIYTCPKPCLSNSDCLTGQTCDKSVLSQKIPNAGVCISFIPTHQTQVYRCENGVKTSLGKVTYGDNNFCIDSSKINYILPGGESSGICVNYEPDICNKIPTEDFTNAKVQIGVKADKIQEMTAEDLIKSSCTSTEQCKNGSSCKSIEYLIDAGYLTEEEANKKLEISKTLVLTSGGAIGGVALCSAIAGVGTLVTGGAGAILFPLCALTGASAGFGIDALFSQIGSKSKENYGYCILESGSSLEQYFGWASLIPITSDKGINGLLNILILLVLIGFIFKK
jgi:hypothetical protein